MGPNQLEQLQQDGQHATATCKQVKNSEYSGPSVKAPTGLGVGLVLVLVFVWGECRCAVKCVQSTRVNAGECVRCLVSVLCLVGGGVLMVFLGLHSGPGQAAHVPPKLLSRPFQAPKYGGGSVQKMGN